MASTLIDFPLTFKLFSTKNKGINKNLTEKKNEPVEIKLFIELASLFIL